VKDPDGFHGHRTFAWHPRCLAALADAAVAALDDATTIDVETRLARIRDDMAALAAKLAA